MQESPFQIVTNDFPTIMKFLKEQEVSVSHAHPLAIVEALQYMIHSLNTAEQAKKE
jgi:hypothetical protein